jgi:hypothetical protein
MPNGQDLNKLENQFHRAMLAIYENALRECRHSANRFLQMVANHGGLQAAKILLHTPGFQYGFTELWHCGRLDITMEALVLKPQYADLFTEEEKQIARDRLQECGYKFD